MKVWDYMRRRAWLEEVPYDMPRKYYALCNAAFGVVYDYKFDVLYDNQKPHLFNAIMSKDYFSKEVEDDFKRRDIEDDKNALEGNKLSAAKKAVRDLEKKKGIDKVDRILLRYIKHAVVKAA